MCAKSGCCSELLGYGRCSSPSPFISLIDPLAFSELSDYIKSNNINYKNREYHRCSYCGFIWETSDSSYCKKALAYLNLDGSIFWLV